jgi:hypothetical protein
MSDKNEDFKPVTYSTSNSTNSYAYNKKYSPLSQTEFTMMVENDGINTSSFGEDDKFRLFYDKCKK